MRNEKKKQSSVGETAACIAFLVGAIATFYLMVLITTAIQPF